MYMKKILLTLVLLSSNVLWAQETVQIVWPFAVSANGAEWVRELANQANKSQSKYTFIFVHKPGAGGTLAALHTLNNHGLTLMSSSSGFFIRPILYPSESYDTRQFTPLLSECIDSPYAIVSKKYRTVADLKNQKRLTIGVILGTAGETVAKELQKILPDTQLDFIGYASTSAGMPDLLGSSLLDLNIVVPTNVTQWQDKINVIGYTGTSKNLNTFAKQGYPGFNELTSIYQIFAPSNINQSTINELHKILYQANNNSPNIKKLYAKDLCVPVNHSIEKTQVLSEQVANFWKNKLKN
jgi:tripartite-type tricarboxylate transporter receptor subunit TctC